MENDVEYTREKIVERAIVAPFGDSRYEESHYKKHRNDWLEDHPGSISLKQYRAIKNSVIASPQSTVFTFVYDDGLEKLVQYGFYLDGVFVIYDLKSDEIKTCFKPNEGLEYFRRMENFRILR